MDNGEKLEGYWVRVRRSVPNRDLKGNPGGYVFSAFLSYHLKEISERSLYLYNHFSIQENATEIYFSAEYHLDKDTHYYSAYIDCYPWYEEHHADLSASNNNNSG
jgi:hypothetical protein